MTDSPSTTLDIRSYLRPLRSRWWIVLFIAVTSLAFTYQYFGSKPATFSASTALLIRPDAGTTSTDPDSVAREQAVIIGTRKVARLVAEDLGVARDPRGLPGVVSAESGGGNFLTLTSTSADMRSAVDLVNAYARVYIRYSREAGAAAARQARVAAEQRLKGIPDVPANQASRSQLEASIQSLLLQENATGFDLQQIEPAVTAQAIGSSPKRSAIFALVLGGLLGLGLVYALEHLDRRLKRLEDVSETFDSPLLVAIPGSRGAVKISSSELRLEPPLTEAFRALRTTLQLPVADLAGGTSAAPRTLLVTSAIAGEGKSTVARNLALAYYEAGLRVALVDADLRRSTLADTFGLAQEPGLADVLRGTQLADALRSVWRISAEGGGPAVTTAFAGEMQQTAVGAGGERTPTAGSPFLSSLSSPSEQAEAAVAFGPAAASSNGVASAPRLSVLTSGRPQRDPAALLAAGPVEDVLSDLAASHDVVIVDTSPLLPVSDALPLLAAVDGVLIVCRMSVTTRPAVEQLTEAIARVPNVNVVGVVANDVREQVGYGSGGYSYGGA